MTEAELIFTALAELSTRQVADKDKADGFVQNARAGVKGGRVAGNARLELERLTDKPVVSGENFLAPQSEIKKIKSKKQKRKKE